MLSIVCYLDEDIGLCPVKKYLEQFGKNDQDFSQADLNLRTFTDIDHKIIHVADNDGQAPRISKPISGYQYIFEIHAARKNKNYIIRIVYMRHNEYMVLLHAFEKPDNYNTKKVRDEIKKEFHIAEGYAKKFKVNPNLYEPYN